MIVTMPDGTRWVTIAEAARTVRVREDLIRQWVSRGFVRSHRVRKKVWVNLDDVQDRELRLRKEGSRPGRPRVAAGATDTEVSH